jgi:hypothetical protein
MSQILHKSLSEGRWFELSFLEQMGNVGSEVGRAAARTKTGEREGAERALDRAFELLDLTIFGRQKNGKNLKELSRARELLAEAFYGDPNLYKTSLEDLEKYFFQFALAARKEK